MLEPKWLSLAKMLEEGSSRRFKCVFCSGTGNNLKVTHNADGYNCYCFRCHIKKFKGHGIRSISKLKLFKATQEFRTEEMKLPKDFSLDIPPEYAVWLYKAGIFKDTAELYGIGWSKSLQRVVLPVYQNSELLYVQARSVIPGMKPKYLNRTASNKSNIVFESKSSKHCLTDKVIVVTEDILSAVRTGVYAKSFSLLGTTLTDAVAFKLSEYKALVLIWLDPDDAGVNSALKVRKKLRSLGTACVIYNGKEDPKYFTNDELKEIINGYTKHR